MYKRTGKPWILYFLDQGTGKVLGATIDNAYWTLSDYQHHTAPSTWITYFKTRHQYYEVNTIIRLYLQKHREVIRLAQRPTSPARSEKGSQLESARLRASS